MNCPSCGTELRMGDRQGVEIDCCPNCRHEDARKKKRKSFLSEMFEFGE